jgi:adenosine deaminase
MLDEALAYNWYDAIPKVELHLHLEGAIPHERLWDLVKKYGGQSGLPDLQSLRARFEFRDFAHFIQTWIWKNQFLREYDDFTFIAEAVASDLAAQRVFYAEVFFTPSRFVRQGLKTQRLTEAIRLGLSRVPGVDIALVADACRDDGPENALRIVSEVNEVRNLGVVGITIGGSEQSYPPEPFAAAYDRARRCGLNTSAHAGEAAGPESVWGAIRSLKVDRIGHGTRAIEDQSLVEYIVLHKIPIEICPISNVRTRVIDSIDSHPVRRYFEMGIPISINTDDPKMFGNSLSEEYLLLESVLGFSREDIRQVMLQSIQASWLSEQKKSVLTQRFRDDTAWDPSRQK